MINNNSLKGSYFIPLKYFVGAKLIETSVDESAATHYQTLFVVG